MTCERERKDAARHARRRFERAIAAEVQAEREAKQDRALLIRRHAMTNPACRRWV